jgi:D-amino peptidase
VNVIDQSSAGRGTSVYVLADLEGSSGCWDRKASEFRTRAWANACRELSLDLDAAVKACLAAGARAVTVRDFHRTCYNVMPELVDARARVIQGYRRGSVPGIGDVKNHDRALFLGMHASSGSTGFLAHTLTTRFREASVNGRPLAEVELFAGVLAKRGVAPVFFSGCPVACAEARAVVPGIGIHPIEKAAGRTHLDAARWRTTLAEAIGRTLAQPIAHFEPPVGPYAVVVRVKAGIDARAMAAPWRLETEGDTIRFTAADIEACYRTLLRLAYLTPWAERLSRIALPLANLPGRWGLGWARRVVQSAALPSTV